MLPEATNQANPQDPCATPSEAILAELLQLRAEKVKWLETQREMMDLMGTIKPEKILHDLRNVLNERVLLRSLAGIEEEGD